jgi:hypothetical protein
MRIKPSLIFSDAMYILVYDNGTLAIRNRSIEWIYTVHKIGHMHWWFCEAKKAALPRIECCILLPGISSALGQSYIYQTVWRSAHRLYSWRLQRSGGGLLSHDIKARKRSNLPANCSNDSKSVSNDRRKTWISMLSFVWRNLTHFHHALIVR